MPFVLRLLTLLLPGAAAGSAALSGAATCPEGGPQAHESFGTSSLIQHQAGSRLEGQNLRSSDIAMHREHDEICTTIENHGTYYSVPLRFGSERQTIDLIVDTGSNALVVADCLCKTCHVNAKKGQCVHASESSSHKLNCFEDDEGKNQSIKMIIAYGSGNIFGYAADDTVRVGGMEKEVKMMMVREAELDFTVGFQGIIGLGLPPNKTWFREQLATQEAKAWAVQEAKAKAKAITTRVKAEGDLMGAVHVEALDMLSSREVALGPHLSKAMRSESGTCGTTFPATAEDRDEVKMLMYGEADGLLEQLGSKRFSMCFNINKPGVLRINQAAAPPDATLASIGTEHWGLGLEGISLNGEPVGKLCTEKKDGMVSPCGFIPDSGTTMITMPLTHLVAVKASLCKKWKICAEAASQASKDAAMDLEVVQATLFDQMLFACERTLATADLEEVLPSIELTASDKDGKTKTLKLSPYAYVVSMNMADPITGQAVTVCQAMLQEMEYETQKNGPIWIVGTPLFHQFTVGFEYDLENPRISFTSQEEEPCSQCGTALTAQGAAAEQRHRIREQTGTPLRPRIDTSRPL